jgi:hypothetical protein
MAHISSIGAGLYSDLSISTDTVPTTLNKTNLDALFASADFGVTAFRIQNVREFPAMGTPPNVVNVPVYGQATTQQIQGQSDAPSMEIQMNYVASEWADGTDLGDLVGDGLQHVFRFALLNAEPAGAEGYASSATGIGDVQNSYWYWVGKIEALQVTPQLTDANTATVTITVQSDFYGAYTV